MGEKLIHIYELEKLDASIIVFLILGENIGSSVSASKFAKMADFRLVVNITADFRLVVKIQAFFMI